jgi:hypothetical protein
MVPALVVQMVPARVVEMVPAAVVEIVPTLVVEIVPALVVEMVPVLENAVAENARVTRTANDASFNFLMLSLLVKKSQGVGRLNRIASKLSLFWADLTNN